MNELYNRYVIKSGINRASIAYRNNKRGKSLEFNNIEINYVDIKKYIMRCKESIPNLIINDDKTSEYICNNNIVTDLNYIKIFVSYLGFSFDGINIRIREKSLFKYYCRAYKKIKFVNSQTGQNKIAARKALYMNYTHLGDKKYSIGKKDKQGKIRHGNFITYARKSHEKFNSSLILKSEINNQIKRHCKYINDKLEK